jgi:formylglycine-generating enzyme required for sulfatase activity
MSRFERRDYLRDFERQTTDLSEKERKIIDSRLEIGEPNELQRMKELLHELNFVRCSGGLVRLGKERGLKCSIEGQRLNETPIREYEMPPFYICKYTVTNAEYERFDSRHTRTNTSRKDRTPVTCITYGRAIGYALWLSEQTGLAFTLPTEPQWIKAVAPYGWTYPHKREGKPERKVQNVYKSFPEQYPEGETGATLEVDSDTVSPNYLGLYHATGNVSVFTLGHYETKGHWGAASDGSYTVVVGGNFRLCPYGSRVLTRGILDVTAIVDTVGIRLVHPDPEYVYEQQLK